MQTGNNGCIYTLFFCCWETHEFTRGVLWQAFLSIQMTPYYIIPPEKVKYFLFQEIWRFA